MKTLLVTLFSSAILFSLLCFHTDNARSESESAEFWADSLSIWIDFTAPGPNTQEAWLAHVDFRFGFKHSNGWIKKLGVVIEEQSSEWGGSFGPIHSDSTEWARIFMFAPDFDYSEHDSVFATIWMHGVFVEEYYKNGQHKIRTIDDFFWMDSVTVAIVK